MVERLSMSVGSMSSSSAFLSRAWRSAEKRFCSARGRLVKDVGAFIRQVGFGDVLGVRDRDEERFAAAGTHARGQNFFEIFDAFRFVGHAQEEIVVQDKERRFVCYDRFFFAPLPKFPENCEAARDEAIAAFHAPLIAIGGGHIRTIEDQLLTSFLLPTNAALGL